MTPNAVKCIRGGLRPEAGLAWGLWSRMGGPPMDNTNAHGIVTKSSYNVSYFGEYTLQLSNWGSKIHLLGLRARPRQICTVFL